ncbi:hypothetical protein GCM10009847_18080 [Leucobacter tardus]
MVVECTPTASGVQHLRRTLTDAVHQQHGEGRDERGLHQADEKRLRCGVEPLRIIDRDDDRYLTEGFSAPRSQHGWRRRVEELLERGTEYLLDHHPKRDERRIGAESIPAGDEDPSRRVLIGDTVAIRLPQPTDEVREQCALPGADRSVDLNEPKLPGVRWRVLDKGDDRANVIVPADQHSSSPAFEHRCHRLDPGPPGAPRHSTLPSH